MLKNIDFDQNLQINLHWKTQILIKFHNFWSNFTIFDRNLIKIWSKSWLFLIFDCFCKFRLTLWCTKAPTMELFMLSPMVHMENPWWHPWGHPWSWALLWGLSHGGTMVHHGGLIEFLHVNMKEPMVPPWCIMVPS